MGETRETRGTSGATLRADPLRVQQLLMGETFQHLLMGETNASSLRRETHGQFPATGNPSAGLPCLQDWLPKTAMLHQRTGLGMLPKRGEVSSLSRTPTKRGENCFPHFPHLPNYPNSPNPTQSLNSKLTDN